ncbi:histidinol-phosphatase [Desulfomarina sp.]
MTPVFPNKRLPLDYKTDHHIHTSFCGHATGEMEEYVLAAIKQKLDGLVFLEHMEEGITAEHCTWLSEEDFDLFFMEGKRLQKKYKGFIEIGLGVECGYNPAACKKLLSRLERRSWAEIGISCHFVKMKGREKHLNLFSRRKESIEKIARYEREEILTLYFESLLEAVINLPGTILCHLDAAMRFLPDIHPTHNQMDRIEQLLDRVKNRGMALELNTSGMAIRGEQFPTRTILEMAVSKKIPLVLGSDSHRPETVGAHFETMKTLTASMHLP